MVSIIASYIDIEMPTNEHGEPILKPVKGNFLFDKKAMIATDMLMNDEIRNRIILYGNGMESLT